ncbi:MAG: S26 family signal peptidase [Parvularcula sp.]|nr:S26 family signal peptidase [Parvularcula sp.]
MPFVHLPTLDQMVAWFFAAAAVMIAVLLACQAYRFFDSRRQRRVRHARIEMLKRFYEADPQLKPVPISASPSAASVCSSLGDKPARRVRSLSFGGKLVGIAVLCAIAAGLTSLASWRDTHALMINATDSLPNWAFFVETGQFPKRGEYVVFHPGTDPLTVKYFGQKPAAFVKIAYGLPGDRVTRAGTDVLVNGTVVASLKPLTKRGDPLEAGPVGGVPEGCVFAATPHKDGFDSRYAHIGFVCRDRLVGIGQPIL